MRIISTLAAIMLLLCSIHSFAQFVYPNEDCAGAIQLSFTSNSKLQDTLWIGDDMADANASPIPHCNGTLNQVRRDLWYTFIAEDTALIIYTRFIPTGDGIANIQLFTGNCGALVSQFCNEVSGTNARLGGLVIGQRYYFRSFFPAGVSFAPSSINHSLVIKPSNDECTGAYDLPITSTRTNPQGRLNFTNEMATLSSVACAPLPSGWTANWEDVWYKFTATATSHAITGRAPSGTRLSVYSGAPGSLTSFNALQFFGGDNSLVLNSLVPGNTYYIRVGSLTSIEFKLGILVDAPTNDDCVNADTIRMSSSIACEYNTIISNRTLANNSPNPCFAVDKDVWFVFQATASNIRIVGGITTQSLRFSLFSGTCGAFTCLATASGVLTYNGLTVGQYYYLQAGGTSGDLNPTSVCIMPRVTNDECTGAIPLIIHPFGTRNPTLVNSQDATQSLAACGGGSDVKDLWYSFVASDTAQMITVDGNGYFQVFSGTCGALTPLHCSSGTAILSTEAARTEKVTGLIPGTTYYLRVYSISGITNTLSIQVSTLIVNDECIGAIELPIRSTLAIDKQEDNYILSASESETPCLTTTNRKDIWYKFTATSNTHTIISQAKGLTSSGGLFYQFYSGSCGSLTSIGCYDHGVPSSALAKPYTFSNLVPGNTYYIRQYGSVRNNSIRVMSGPANDDITGAVQLRPTPTSVNGVSYHQFGATRRFGKICSASSVQMDHDVWFYFVAEATSHSISTNAYNSYWPEQTIGSYRIEAFRGFAPDSLSLVPKLITCGTNSLNLTNLVIGDTVYLRVGAFGINATNIFGIRLLGTQSLDEPTGAVLLSRKNTFELNVTTTGATQSMPAGCIINDFPDDDIWFKFIAAADIKRIAATNETRDITLQLFSGTPGNLTPIICSNNIMLLPNNLVNGTQYYLRAYSKVNGQAATFDIGLFGEEDLYANTLGQSTTNLGPNLITNARCEDENRTFLVSNVSSGPGVPGKALANGWWTTTTATSDAFHSDMPVGVFGNAPGNSGYGVNKVPRSGKGMLGMLNASSGQEWSEYVTGKLVQPVRKGKTYFVSFYISFAEGYQTHAYNVGALFSNDSLYTTANTDAIVASPQVAMTGQSRYVADSQWYNICGYFTADKDANFVTLGNFGEHELFGGNGQITYFFLDDVVISEVLQPIVLPVRLLDFNGRLNAQQQTALQWMTSGENNTNRFEVEWRTENGSFQRIGTITAAGNSSTNRLYDFIHNDPVEGFNYYRLKMIDRDGQFTYSPVIRINKKNNGNSMVVYPNPVDQLININAVVEREQTAFFKLIDNYGRIVFTRQRVLQKGTNAFSWDTSSLPAGTYYLLSSVEGQAAVKVVKR